MRRGLVQIREADKLMSNAALIQRCVDIPHDETPAAQNSAHTSSSRVRVRDAPLPFARARWVRTTGGIAGIVPGIERRRKNCEVEVELIHQHLYYHCLVWQINVEAHRMRLSSATATRRRV
jgi:hypothetical protein